MVIVVPLVGKVLRGSIPGYVVFGIVLGVLGLKAGPVVTDLGEYGIVFLLFAMGLELQPSRLWAMRSSIFGMGSMQLVCSSTLLCLLAMLLGLSLPAAVVAGLALSLSSTVIAMETLTEKNELATKHGRSATAIALFQILSVIPILAAIQLLAPDLGNSLVSGGWTAKSAQLLGFILFVWVARFLLRPFLRFLSSTRNSGLMTGGVLFVLIGTSSLSNEVGLTTELGAFLAGVLFANSEYRHDVEQRVEPFKGLLIGIFLVTLGIVHGPFLTWENVRLTIGLIAIKFTVLFLIGKLYNHSTDSAINLALTLSQAGELALVVSIKAAGLSEQYFISSELPKIAVLSMVATPLLFEPIRQLRRFFFQHRNATDDTSARKLRIFISYSRRDTDKAFKLVNKLETEEFDVLIDSRDLPFGEEWQIELDYMIRESDVVLWLISPSSIRSKWCRWELGKVSEFGKRLIPVSIESVPHGSLPEDLRKIQVFPQSGVIDILDAQQMKLLMETLNVDRMWQREHTRLSERARLWEQNERSSDWLLRGAELAKAEKWRDEKPKSKPKLHASLLDLIHSSRVAEP